MQDIHVKAIHVLDLVQLFPYQGIYLLELQQIEAAPLGQKNRGSTNETDIAVKINNLLLECTMLQYAEFTTCTFS